MKPLRKWSIPAMLMAGLLIMLISSCEKKSDGNDNPVPVDPVPNDTSNLSIPPGWSKVGDLKANEMVWSITSDAAGNVYAAGYFTNGSGYNYVARWNGSKWEDIGLKANSSIYALTTDSEGKVYAVGNFSNGATPNGGNHYVARWDGTSWSDIGPSRSDLMITADAVGNVYNCRAKWNGSAWIDFAILNPEVYGSINSLATTSSGNAQYAGGSFAHISGLRYIALWNGAVWSELGNLNANADIQTIVADNSGNVYAAGSFTDGNLPTTGSQYVAKWNGTSWINLGNFKANGQIYYLAVDKNTGFVYASGYFSNDKGEYYIAKWDGTSWNDLGNMALSPTPIYVSPAGKLYSVVASNDGKEYCVVVHE